MASIVVALTFLAGIDGMSFESMPALHHRLASPVVLAAMLAVGTRMLADLWRKGWLGSRP